MTKYSQQYDIFGNSSTCIPVVFEHFVLFVGVEELRVYYVIYQPFQSTKMDRTTALISVYTAFAAFPLRCNGVMQE